MSMISKNLKVTEVNSRKRVLFYIVLLTLFVNAVIVVFNFLFTCLGYYRF
ncbi:MAG TPA: hypothetical protein PLC07_06200 [Bacillota bacterium]|nr:hypothetical protein [Bacillota bacterium]HPT86989.1 hypothetical protein [Bacillota bacterium]